MVLAIQTESWTYKDHFTSPTTCSPMRILTTREEDAIGRREPNAVYYHDVAPGKLTDQIEVVRDRIEVAIDQENLCGLHLASDARNALDCAMWVLETERTGIHVWKVANICQPIYLHTTLTIGADAPEQMAATAHANTHTRACKLKLTDSDAKAYLLAVRTALPDVWIGGDANQGFTRRELENFNPSLVDSPIGLIERPLPRGEDGALAGLRSPIPLVADESAQSLSDIEQLATHHDLINTKLDRCGGLTEGLLTALEARQRGLRIMVGCMNGTPLAMEPGFVLGQLCDFVDLDVPIFLARDHRPSAGCGDGNIWCTKGAWGAAT
ncbi:MAG: enolase C-terminal domain-like protein [Rhodanobacteraceae bacterium]